MARVDKSRGRTAQEAHEKQQAVTAAEGDSAKSEELRERILALNRRIDALLWQNIDSASEALLSLLTLGAEDIASRKVRARVPTGITISYDDGWTYHSERRLGGIQFRPVILEFEHADPKHVGSVREAIQMAAPEALARYLEGKVKSKPDGE
jgi:hypothetical protein